MTCQILFTFSPTFDLPSPKAFALRVMDETIAQLLEMFNGYFETKSLDDTHRLRGCD